MANKKTLVGVLSVVAGLAVAFVSTPAHAAPPNPCVVSKINTDYANGINVLCTGSSVWYHAGPGNCGATSDGVKGYLSVAEAALLSGKNLVIFLNGATGCTNEIVYMEMQK